MKLSIIVPAYNEERTILTQLELISRVHFKFPYEIIVVNDGSTDSTHERILTANKTIKNLKVISYNKNKGKGHALRLGISNAKGDIIVLQDADLEYNPKQIPKLINEFLKNKAEVVYGSRFLEKNKSIYWMYAFGNKFLSLSTSILFGKRVTDMETGYKVFSKHVFKKLKINAEKFDFEPEVTAKILKNGFRITEVPISYKGRTKEMGKKITVADGIKAFFTLLKYRFTE